MAECHISLTECGYNFIVRGFRYGLDHLDFYEFYNFWLTVKVPRVGERKRLLELIVTTQMLKLKIRLKID